jgi:hypothetical protein
MLKNATKNMRFNDGVRKKQHTCTVCDYACCTVFLYNQHTKTKKHIFNINAQKCSRNMRFSDIMVLNTHKHIAKHDHNKSYKQDLLNQHINTDPHINTNCCCGKKYKHVQSYYRHIKKCKIYKITNNPNNVCEITESNLLDNNIIKNLLDNLIIQNNNIITENKEMREIIKTIIPKIENKTTINNQFNINMFLNETCKDAINLTDFVKTLSLDCNDLQITRKNGYINGIANIFIKNLEQLDLHKRPIHCSNYKNEILYVKDNNSWEIENSQNGKLKNAINTISKKQFDTIKHWELENPNWNTTDKGKTMYCELVNVATSSNTDKINDKNNDKIIKIIAKEVILDN